MGVALGHSLLIAPCLERGDAGGGVGTAGGGPGALFPRGGSRIGREARGAGVPGLAAGRDGKERCGRGGSGGARCARRRLSPGTAGRGDGRLRGGAFGALACPRALKALLVCACGMGTAARCRYGVCLKRVASNTQSAAPYAQNNSGQGRKNYHLDFFTPTGRIARRRSAGSRVVPPPSARNELRSRAAPRRAGRGCVRDGLNRPDKSRTSARPAVE